MEFSMLEVKFSQEARAGALRVIILWNVQKLKEQVYILFYHGSEMWCLYDGVHDWEVMHGNQSHEVTIAFNVTNIFMFYF